MNAIATVDLLLLPERRVWTRETFERAGDLGFFGPEDRVELIDGEVINKLAPQRSPHAVTVVLAESVVRHMLPGSMHIRVQLPLGIGSRSEPEPDIAVVMGEGRDYIPDHPSTAELIVEVADSSLKLDRGMKRFLYASAGVKEYWVINLPERVVEVSRDPSPAADAPLGADYAATKIYSAGESFGPLLSTGTSVAVNDLLP